MKYTTCFSASLTPWILSIFLGISLGVSVSSASEAWPRHTIDDSSQGADGVRLMDVNHDGRQDIVTGWEEGGLVRLYLHPGTRAVGEPWPAVTVGKVASPEDAVFVDLDNDGHVDVVSSCEGREKSVFVHWAPKNEAEYLNPTAWKTEPFPATRKMSQWMFALPVQVDGKYGTDLVVGSKGSSGVVGWLQAPQNARDLAAWKFHPFCRAGWIMSLRSIDIDADGDQDILLSDRKGDTRGIHVLENPGSASSARGDSWTKQTLSTDLQEPMFLDTGDLDADGQIEVACATRPEGIALLQRGVRKQGDRKQGDRKLEDQWQWKTSMIALPPGVGLAKSVAIGDINLDGQADIVLSCAVAGNGKSGLRWLSRDPASSSNPWRDYEISGPAGIKFDRVELIDLDSDGDLDVLTCEERENLGVFWYENPTRSKPSELATDVTLKQPNIVFIFADDLGWTDLACFGSRYYRTENIDRLAKEGMRFTAAYTCGPNCAPTRASLMSGQYTPRHGIYTVGSGSRGKAKFRRLIPPKNKTELESAVITLPETLRSAGYATIHLGKWHLGNPPRLGPREQGFDINIAGFAAGHPRSYFAPYHNPYLSDGEPGENLTDRLTDQAVRFIREHRKQPFFVYMAYYAVHTPIEAKEMLAHEYENRPSYGGHRNPKYAAMVETVDQGVGRILKTLDELQLSDNTLVVFTSDNGGVGGYRDAGVEGGQEITSQAPLRGGKGMLYEGGIRVPLIVRLPGVTEPSSQCDVPVITVDFYPTISAIAHAPMPEQICDGVDISPLLHGQSLPMRSLYWHFPGYLQANIARGTWRTTPASVIQKGKWKLIEFYEDTRRELYDLSRDIGEKNNLIEQQSEIATRLQADLARWRTTTKAPLPKQK